MDTLKMTIGKFGRWHFFLFVLLWWFGFCMGFHILCMTFLAPNIDHWCAKPDNLANVSDEQWKGVSMVNVTDSLGKVSRSQCLMYDLPYSNMSKHEFLNVNVSQEQRTTPCKSYQYDTSQYTHTLIDKWQLVCDRDVLVSIATSVGMAGLIVGVFTMGQLSDRYGRRPVVLVGNLIWILAAVFTHFCEYYVIFVILRFINLAVAVGSLTVVFVIFAECISDHERAIWGNLASMGFASGFMTLAGLGYGLHRWEYIQLVLTSPLILTFIVSYFYLPESPRWLLINGRINECVEVVKNIIKVNKSKERKDEDLMKDLTEQHRHLMAIHHEESKKTVIDLVRTPKLRVISLCMFFNWFTTSFVYYAQSMSAGNLGGSVYINFFLAGAVEIPAIVVVIIATLKFGRKFTYMALTLIGALGCFFTIPVPDHMTWLRVTFAMIGKFGMSASFPLIYVYASEVFPTPVRNVGVGTSSMFARVGTALSPYVKEIALETNKHVPQGIAGTLALIGLGLAWFLPETGNRKLPETIDEVEHGSKEDEEEEESLKNLKSEKEDL